jgi:hypothetical protein
LKIPGARKFTAKDGSLHVAIPHPAVYIGEKGAYLDCDMSERRETDDYGNTHSITLQQTKEDRQAKAPKTYIGNAKTLTFGSSSAPSAAPQRATQGYVETDDNEDDIPF